jgi:DNA invertase Pin-like site-specific DNA recombinase
MRNALAYARVSTKEQAEKGLSIPAQLKAIKLAYIVLLKHIVQWLAKKPVFC